MQNRGRVGQRLASPGHRSKLQENAPLDCETPEQASALLVWLHLRTLGEYCARYSLACVAEGHSRDIASGTWPWPQCLGIPCHEDSGIFF